MVRYARMGTAKVQKISTFIKILLVLLLVAGTVLIALYPLGNQPVTVIVYNGNTQVEKSFSVDEIENLNGFEIPFPSFSLEKFTEVRLVRFFRTICVDKIQSGVFDRYAVVGNGGLLSFNAAAADLLRANSHSAVMERLILAEALLAAVMLLLIAANAIEEALLQDDRGNHGPIYEIGKFCSQIARYREYMFFAARADLNAEVANSFLNRLWWLLEPFFNMLVYVTVFGRVMGNSVQYYATFVYSALLMWTFFNKTIMYSVKCIRTNRDIVTKVYMPKHVLILTNMVLNFLKMLFSCLVLIPMLFIFKVHITSAVFFIFPTYVLMFLLSFGIGMIFMHYGVYVDDLSYASGILLQMLMFLSGIFYDVITSLPKPLNTMLLCLNPVAMFVDTMRNALLNGIVCNVPLVVLWTLIALLLGYMGIHIVYKNENSYVKVI